jgi:Cadherin-like/Bacterial Ig domain
VEAVNWVRFACLLLSFGILSLLAHPLSANEQPTLDPLVNITILEDSGGHGIALSGIGYGADASAQTISVTATSSNLTVLLNPTVVYSSPAASGTLLLATLPNQFGTSIITVTVQDSGGTAGGFIDTRTRSFTVTVVPVNDQPSLNIISDQIVNEDVGTQNITLNGISSGASNETSDSVTLTAVSSNTALIPNPGISYTSGLSQATLSFTPSANRFGSATVVVTASDNGGTANGGVAATYQSFTISVNSVADTPSVVNNNPLTLPIGTSAVIARGNLEVSDFDSADGLTYRLISVPSDGVLSRNGNQLLINNTFTQADINAGLFLYRHTGTANNTDTFSFTVTNVANLTLSTTTFSLIINGAAGASTPSVTLPSSATTWIQGNDGVIIDPAATVSDSSGTLVGGSLSVTLLAPTESGDELSFRNIGTGSGQIGLSGSVLTFGGFTIGTLSGNNSPALTVALAGSATPAAVQALLRTTRFASNNSAPSSLMRTVQVVVTNGTNTSSAPVTIGINVQPVNQAPVINFPKTSIAYLEASGEQIIDNSAIVSDADSLSFSSGYLTAAWITTPDSNDDLTIQTQGSGSGKISVSGTDVSYGGVLIGQLSGGTAGTTLTVTFNSAATPAAAQALARRLSYCNNSNTPSLDLRQMSIRLNDGAGGQSNTASVTVVVQASNNPPTLTLPSPDLTWIQASGPQVIDAAATITDVDNLNFSTGVLVAEFVSTPTLADRLTILSDSSAPGRIDVVGTSARFGGVAIGQITEPGTLGSALAVQLNSNATIAATQELVRRLAFEHQTLPAVDGTHDVRVYLTDGSGGTSLPVTTTITVQSVNAPPVVTIPASVASWTEGDPASLLCPLATLSDDHPAGALNGGVLSLTIGNGVAGDALNVRSNGVGAGQVSVTGSNVFVSGVQVGTYSAGNYPTPLSVNFTTAATLSAAQAILRAVQFEHPQEFTLNATRNVVVTLNDGGVTSAPATAQIQVIPINDPPTTSNLSLATVVDIAITGTLPGSDPELDALTWEITTAPTFGTVLLTNSSTGAFTFTPALGQSATATFSYRVSDGTAWSSVATATVRVSLPVATERPIIVSSPPREGIYAGTLTYLITVDTSALPPGYDLRYQLVSLPSGANCAVTRTTATTATLTWTQSGTTAEHKQVGVIVSDAVTGTASYQAIQVHWSSTAPGGAG